MHDRLVVPEDRAPASILDETLNHLKNRVRMRCNVSRPRSTCCAPTKYELLQTAPQSALLTPA
jgi:hypothetical protein